MSSKNRDDNLEVDLLDRLNGLLDSLSPAERTIGEYILENRHSIPQMTLAEVAKNSGVSDATAVRFFRSVGFSRWIDFIIALSQTIDFPHAIHEEVNPSDSVGEVTQSVFHNAIRALRETAAVIDAQDMEKGIDYLQTANKILILGAGTSRPVAQDMFNRLFRLGLNILLETDPYLQVMQCALLTPEDVIVVISQTGESSNTIKTARVAKSRGCKIICITGNRLSTLAKLADVVLLSVSHEVLQETIASRIAQHTIAHAIYISLALKQLDTSLENERTIWNALIRTGTESV